MKGGGVAEGLKPVASMVVVQVAFAGVNILYKLAINDGMDMKVLVAYRYIFASAVMTPLAFFLEREKRAKLTMKVLILAFLCGLFGCVLAQNFYVASIRLTSATFSSAMTNLVPAITFVLAVLLRLEKLKMKSASGQAKVLGTLVGVGGAMLLTFYKGVEINIWPKQINLLNSSSPSPSAAAAAAGTLELHKDSSNRFIGSLYAVSSCLSYATWLIIQAKMSIIYPYNYTNTALMCLMGAIQAVFFALCSDRDWSKWRFGLDIRLLTVAYTGVVASALILTLLNWCIKKKGPLFVSIFNPLMLVIVAILSSILLNEKLHLGSVLGAALIVVGLYAVLWGKGRESAAKVGDDKSTAGPLPAPEGSNSDVVIEINASKGLQEKERTSYQSNSSSSGAEAQQQNREILPLQIN